MKILLAKGKFKDGKFIALKPDGSEFKDADYDELIRYNSDPSTWFAQVSPEEYAAVTKKVKTIYSCGGVTFLTVQALSAFFYDSIGNAWPLLNPYGSAIMSEVREGNAS